LSQILQEKTDYDKFIEALTVIGKYNYGKPLKNYPRYVSFQNTDKHFPSDSVLEKGSKAVRAYWNNKNLIKRGNK